MTIDIDKIKKLIRLANNNPNEHEANLAARKVCSMLKDYTFGKAPKTKTTRNDWSGFDPFAEWFRTRAQTQYHAPRYDPPPRGKCVVCGYMYPHLEDGTICLACQERARRRTDTPDAKINCNQCKQDYTYSGQDRKEMFTCAVCQLKNMKEGLNPDGTKRYRSPFMGDF